MTTLDQNWTLIYDADISGKLEGTIQKTGGFPNGVGRVSASLPAPETGGFAIGENPLPVTVNLGFKLYVRSYSNPITVELVEGIAGVIAGSSIGEIPEWNGFAWEPKAPRRDLAHFFEDTGGLDINTAALTPIPFPTDKNVEQDFIEQTSPTLFTVLKAGIILARYSVPWANQNNQRKNIKTELRIDGGLSDRGVGYGFSRRSAEPNGCNTCPGDGNYPVAIGTTFEVVGSRTGGSGSALTLPGSFLTFEFWGQ